VYSLLPPPLINCPSRRCLSSRPSRSFPLFPSLSLLPADNNLLSLPTLGLLLSVPLRIDLGGEGVFEAEGDLVYREDQRSKKDARWLAVPQSSTQEAHRRTVVHGRTSDVEREAGDDLVHQNAEVVAEVGPRDAEGPHGGQDEDVAAGDEDDGQALREEGLEGWMAGLVPERSLVEGVPDDAEGEDGGSEAIAAVEGVSAGELRQSLVAVLEPGNGIPECRVKDYCTGSDYKGGASGQYEYVTVVLWADWRVWAVRTVEAGLAEVNVLVHVWLRVT